MTRVFNKTNIKHEIMMSLEKWFHHKQMVSSQQQFNKITKIQPATALPKQAAAQQMHDSNHGDLHCPSIKWMRY
jgi:hypothetical protein